MASQQAYQAYAQQNKGTLVPGQTIAVNKYTVQVERYLSQGGFAHVYLVRTPTPVYNTTHHVLKRIAVANEAMLSEVKREVDIMRVLKGHPNIVHLIDAAWHRLPNNTYEVFILMEYCPGGGIIDMMNRRLRERLTEADILQIFVDVCEGVAFMHNSRPPLLHRDLKVENILQSSPTSYKLCDFGSATTVHRPATNTQEIRALEAELGRHTTMQYRAPEMIDLYSKRPIDEKSDVWALGVLLYKLCYYTTPFEEHGSLAILNVQYRIPPYPVYSSQMNSLIGSMLREHGTQRPTVFELLKHVHYLRGTKSSFTYNIPIQPPLVPRHTQLVLKTSASPVPGLNSANHTGHRQIASGLRSAPATSGSPPKNSAVQARERVLEAIAPMRRGRPNQTTEGSSSRRPSPQTHAPSRSMTVSSQQASTPKESNWLDKEEASYNAQAEARAKANALFDEAWGSGSGGKDKGSRQATLGFENDFAEKLWGASNPNTSISTPPKADLKPPSHLQPSANTVIKPLSHTGNNPMRNGRDKDAFEGLGLMASVGKPAPTLAEARMLRTGLAIMSTQTNHYGTQKQAEAAPQNAVMSRPTPSPRQTYLTPSSGPLQASSRSPTPNPDPWRVSPSSTSPGLTPIPKDGPIESRYPSLEEIDAQFSAASLYPFSAQSEQWTSGRQAHASSGPTPSLPPLPVGNGEDHGRSSGRQTQSSSGTTPSIPPRPVGNGNREENDRSSRFNVPSAAATLDPLGKIGKTFEARSKNEWKSSSVGESKVESSKSQTGSATMRFAMEGMTATQSTSKPQHETKPLVTDKYKPSSSPTKSSRPLPQSDWLTGDDITSNLAEKASTGPVVRDTAAKRTSVIIPSSEFKLQDALAAQYDSAPVMQPEEPRPPEISPTVARFAQAFPPIDTTIANDDPTHNEPLTDNWSPVVSNQPSQAPQKGGKQKEPKSASASSADEDGPEDLGGLSTSPKKGNSLRIRRKGRQSSVHELVDLWGGGVPKEKPDPTPTKPTAVSDKPGIRSRPRPTSLMPPARKPSLSGRSVSGSARVSPARVSPINRDPSPQKSPLVDSFPPPSSSVTSPGSGRSRPQSMFVFPPPKPSETPRPTTLSPPEEDEATPRPARRKTSISDMVNRYEAIGGKVIAPQQIAIPVSRKPSFNRNAVIPPSQAETGRVQVLPTPEKPTPSSRDEYRPARIAAEPAKERKRAMSSGLAKPSIDISRTVAKPRRVSPIEKQDSLPKKTVDVASRLSTKQEAGNNLIFPKRKPTLPSAEEQLAAATSLSVSNDDRPSSPERPYQGVGKLIDQWQRKTEQSDGFSRPPAVKRTGLVPTNRG